MSPLRFPTWRLVLMLAIAPLLTLLCGCVPNVVWLPDNSGVIYTAREGASLRHYDLARKTSRELVADTKSKTPWVGLSPDGKRVAVARLRLHPDRDSTMEVISYDLTGKEVKRSRAHKWNEDRSDKVPKLEIAMVHWSLPGKLIIHAGTTGLYDYERDQLLIVPEEIMPWPTGNVPTRPDGKLFLAEVKSGEQRKLALVDWAGKITALDWVIPQEPLAHPHVDMTWDGRIARLVSAEATWLVDTDKKTVTKQDKGAPDVLKGIGELRNLHVFPEGGYRVCVFESKDEKVARIELQKPSERKVQVLVPRANPVFTLFPSPDRKRVAIRFEDPDKEKTERILLLDDQGKTLANFEVKE